MKKKVLFSAVVLLAASSAFAQGNGMAGIYNPQNEMFRLLGTKRSFSQNETFFFSHPYPPTLPFSA